MKYHPGQRVKITDKDGTVWKRATVVPDPGTSKYSKPVVHILVDGYTEEEMRHGWSHCWYEDQECISLDDELLDLMIEMGVVDG